MVKKSDIHSKTLPLKTWLTIAKDTFFAMGEKNFGGLAAGIAFFMTLSFFPFIAATVAIAGTVIEPSQLTQVVTAVSEYLPKDIANLITTQLANAVQDKNSNFFVATISLLIALFSISGAVNAAMTATNAAYELNETRNPVKLKLIAMLWTLEIIVSIAIVLPILFVSGDFLRAFGVSDDLMHILGVARWLVLLLLAALGLAYFYHYGPNRANTKFQWVSWGAIIATVMWLLITALFFVYLQYFANFSDSYSLFAGIIAMMMWLNLSALVLLIGAEINHRLDTHAKK